MGHQTHLGRTGLEIFPFGFECDRVGTRAKEYREALLAAIAAARAAGSRLLVETRPTSGDGDSERLIGQTCLGSDAVIVTKIGYEHCLSPERLDDQLTRSLARLERERVDVLLLDHPEYFLRAGGTHAEYYARLGRAFEHLEREVARGRISWYGISSDTFPDANDSLAFTSLETVLELAERAGPRHRFGVIQFPFNLFEPGAAMETNNTGKTVLELARAKNIGTLVSRPLTAFVDRKLIRLTDFPSHHGENVEAELGAALNAALQVEAEHPKDGGLQIARMAWGHILQRNAERLNDWDAWSGFVRHTIEPALEEATALELPGDWLEHYLSAERRLIRAYTAALEATLAKQSRLLESRLDATVSALTHAPRGLAPKALNVLRSVPGVDCVVVEMRNPADVARMSESATAPLLTAEQAMDALDAMMTEVRRSDEDHSLEII